MSTIQDKTEDYTQEKKVKEIYSKADILYFSVLPDSTISSCNVTALEKLEYGEKDLYGKKFLMLFDESHHNEIQKLVKTCLAKGFVKNYECVMLDKAGSTIWVKLNGLCESDSRGEPEIIRFFIQDISLLVKCKVQNRLCIKVSQWIHALGFTIEMLEKSLDDIQRTFKGDGIGLLYQTEDDNVIDLYKWDSKDEDTDKLQLHDLTKLTSIYETCQRGQGCEMTPSGTFWTGSLSDLILGAPSDDEKNNLLCLSEFESLVFMPIKNGEITAGYFILGKRKEWAWDELDIEFLEDLIPTITKFDKTQRANFQSNDDQIYSVFDVPCIGVLGVKEGKVHFVNTWCSAFLGYDEEELKEKPIASLLAPESKDEYKKLSDTKLIKDICFLTKSSQKVTADLAYSQLHFNGTILDILYLIENEEKRKLQKHLLQARKMESMGMLAGGIVHDFNNLLACILGFSSLLSEEISEENPYYDDIQQITRTSEKATDLAARLMAYAQGGSYIVEFLDMNQIIKEIAAILSRMIDSKIAIRANLDPDLVAINADASQIQQAILQIALNARDAMPEDGKITFQTRNITIGENDAYLRFGGKPGRYIQISISDNGNGMSKDVKEHIFESHFTTKGEGAGKGLGLSMVQEIIDNHHGFITVFSQKDNGTVFKMFLPANAKVTNGIKPVSEKKPPLGKETILLVDDEKVLRETARKMLTRYGYKVISAESGTEAVAIYKKYKERIDLVVLDMIMPGMEINKVLAWFRKINPRVKIIASSGMAEKVNVETGFQRNVAGYIHKPFQVRPLLTTVRSILNA